MIEFIREAGRGPRGCRDLSFAQAEAAAGEMLDGRATDAQVGALLLSLRVKGETGDEIAGFARALSGRVADGNATTIRPGLVDCAGPHDGRKSFAATIPVSVLCALAGVPTVLHSSPSLPPKDGVGLGEILAGLGLGGAAFGVERAVADLGRHALAFVDAETAVPGLGALRRIRTEIGVRSVWNHAEKLADFCGAEIRIVGVHHATVFGALQRSAELLGNRMALFQGNDGSEDLPTHRKSVIVRLGEGEAVRTEVDPEALGLGAEAGPVLEAEGQVSAIRAVLEGDTEAGAEAFRKQVLLNVAARLWVAGAAPSLTEGALRARELLDSGRAWGHLRAWAGNAV